MFLKNITSKRWLLAACLASLPAVVWAARGTAQDDSFLAARDAFRDSSPAKLGRYAAELKGHPLESWAEYWKLQLKLDGASTEEVRAFLARHANTYVAESLRHDWMRVLGKQEEWALFLQELPKLAERDADITCYALAARWRDNDEAAFAQFKAIWNSPRELPNGCVPLARAALRSGQLDAPQVWQRFRLLTDASATSVAKHTVAYLPSKDAPGSGQIDAAAKTPTRLLARLPDLRTRAGRELTILAVSRLARNDPELAAEKWDAKLRGRFSAEDQAYVWAQIATQGARKHLVEATGWFAQAGDALNDEQLAWWARIALRQQNWAEVRAAIERMSPAARNDMAWVYWSGRALRELGQAEQAKATFDRIAGLPQFYGQLAAGELGRIVQVPPRPTPPTQEELAEVESNPGLQRALALYRFKMRADGMREWNWTVRGMSDRMLLAAAELARRNEVWDRSINTADRTVAVHDYGVRYLAPYGEILGAQARAHSLEEHWVLGLVRQESRFHADAKSSVGASGLMQLMPRTAHWIAKKVKLRDYSWSRITNVDVNARLGTAYLKQVLDGLDGSPVLATAAYNAGPGRASRWRGARALEGAVYAESIPFTETRDYVKKVMANTVFYSALLGGPMRTLKDRLGVITPRGSLQSIAALDELP